MGMRERLFKGRGKGDIRMAVMAEARNFTLSDSFLT